VLGWEPWGRRGLRQGAVEMREEREYEPVVRGGGGAAEKRRGNGGGGGGGHGAGRLGRRHGGGGARTRDPVLF